MRFLRLIGRHSSLILTIIWTAIIVTAIIAPLLMAISPKAGVLLYSALKPLCHQADGRCYHLGTFKMGLCTRCTGVFFGLAVFGWIALIFRPRREMKFTYFVLTLLPLAIDGFGNLFELWSTGNNIRMVTGLIFAFGIVFWTYPFIFNLERPDFPEKVE